EIADIGREVGIGELTLAAADAGEVEAQHGNVAGAETFRNPRCREDVLAAGETMGEQGECPRPRRQVKTSRQISPGGTGKLDLSGFDHGSSSFRQVQEAAVANIALSMMVERSASAD